MELVDERVFTFAQGAQRHFGTNDLMVLLDFREEVAELEAIPRQRLADAEELPLALRLKFARPASDIKQVLGAPDQSFWFLVIFEDGDFECGAMNASLVAPGGTA
jgi:hypothetical protein